MTDDLADDPALEAFLRRFEPRRPPPLRAPAVRPPRARPVAVWIAAAAVAVAVGAMLAVRGPPRTPSIAVQIHPPPRPTVGALHAALRAGSYEAALDEMDARLLPDPARPGGALAGLADVRRDWR
ncbi:MAG TPA: hypothetical protein VF310_13350 [Vicinamibacteria bacterium]